MGIFDFDDLQVIKEADFFLFQGASRSWFLLMLYNTNIPPSTQKIVELTALL